MISFSRIQGRSLAPNVAPPLKADATTLLLKKLLPCLRPSPKLEKRCVTTQGNAELETGSRKQGSEKKASFCLQQVQGLKDSAAHPHTNFPQVCLRPGQRHAFFEQYPGASFASPGILDFRLIVTSYTKAVTAGNSF